ncbi:hypothetical protein WJX72_009904 [[Myrmecia] bisecta]|uniref:Uncharacterized protein n=1 Tax=[Myrmecia] bisecta TaxID=41462 RepID=A0AAW1QTG2_9CHLO
MASETDRKFWLGVLRGVFASQAKPAIRESKVTKRAVQLAAEKGHKGSKAERKAGLAAFVQQASAEKLIQAKRDKVKTGRFSAAEDAQIREAVNTYADAHGHSKDDLSWLYKVRGKGSQDAYGAWKDIASALPHRTVKSVYAHGTRVLHEGNYQGRWDAEEDAQLRELVETGGQKWKAIGAALGRIPEGCRDRWKEIRMGEQRRSGAWSEEEVRKLRDAVEEYLTLKQDHEAARREATLSFADISGAGAQPAAADGRLLLDDIDWGLISDKVGTRSNNQCLDKWYNQLCPSMVSKGEWGSGDDRRLLRALLLSGCSHDWETDWGGLVAGRTAGQARRRWRLMLKCVPDRADKDFLESLDFLVSTYCPGLKAKLEAAAAAAAEAE